MKRVQTRLNSHTTQPKLREKKTTTKGERTHTPPTYQQFHLILRTSHHITPHHITLHDITLHHITSQHITSHHTTSHHITSHYITSHYITSHHITSHHTTSHHITSPHITSPHTTSHHLTSPHITQHPPPYYLPVVSTSAFQLILCVHLLVSSSADEELARDVVE